MEYIRAYKSFINSHYLTEAIRMTAGILLPAFFFNYFDQLGTGLVVSLGAYFVSIADGPGPVHHRRNGLLICSSIIFLISLLSGYVQSSPWLLGICIAVCCFLFSMIGVFGARANSIGIAALVVLALGLDHTLPQADTIERSSPAV